MAHRALEAGSGDHGKGRTPVGGAATLGDERESKLVGVRNRSDAEVQLRFLAQPEIT